NAVEVIDGKLCAVQVHRLIEAKCDQDVCSGYTAVLHPHKAIVMSFRGTNTVLQLIQEINKTVFVSWYRWIFGGQVSMYFGDAFVKIWNKGMGEDFVALRNKYPDYEIWVTGHSLGGAIASLASSYIIGGGYADAKKTKLVTFGQPRTGDVDYSAAHNTQARFYCV
ncbi:triacylglycerol lipase, partial [Ancylostoma caninum]